MARYGINASKIHGASAFALSMLLAVAARADVFEWEYVDPNDPSQGKQESTTLTPDGAGRNAVPNAHLVNFDFTRGYFFGADLQTTRFIDSNLTEAYFDSANLRRVSFRLADLTDASLADVTATQVSFDDANLTNVDFTGANLYQSWFTRTTLAGTNFTDANVSGADFGGATVFGFTASQLYSTASHQNGMLAAIDLSRNNLTGWDFSNQELSNSDFDFATLDGTSFQNAVVFSAGFYGTTARGFTSAALYSTQSYMDKNLGAIRRAIASNYAATPVRIA
jgi:uncharacterized protein YjbI with pentapeptide repeats